MSNQIKSVQESITRAENVQAAVMHAARMIPDIASEGAVFSILTCDEAEAFADIFRTAGYIAEADEIIESHALDDLPGDKHYTVDNEDDEGACLDAGEHQVSCRHRWQDCPVYDDMNDDEEK